MTDTAIGEVTVEVIAPENNESQKKTPEQLAREIKELLIKTKSNVIEIGLCLIDAKKQVHHGEWGAWLKNNIDFTQNAANKFMRCAEWFANYAPANNLNSSQMMELLALPKAEAKNFINEKFTEGNSVENMPKLQLREAIKIWKSAHLKKLDSDVATIEVNEDENSNANVNSEDLKNVQTLLEKGRELTEKKDIKKLFAKYAKENPDVFNEQFNALKKIVGIIKSVKI